MKGNSLREKRPDLALQWDSSLNGSLTPDNTSYGSHARVYWTCPDCGRSYQASVGSRTFKGSAVASGKERDTGRRPRPPAEQPLCMVVLRRGP